MSTNRADDRFDEANVIDVHIGAQSADTGDEEKASSESQSALAKLIEWFTNVHPKEIEAYVDKIRQQNPDIDDDALARKIMGRKSFKSGLVGAATGVGGLITLPVTVPADVVACWKIQIFMACCIAYIYGHTAKTTDLKTDVYLILVGNGAKEALKRVGIEAGKHLTKKAVQKYITREVMKKLWVILGRKVITKAGQKSLASFTKMVPLIGAPIGFGFDYVATRGIGHFAIKYYSGRG